MTQHVIIGIGNRLRGDDGAGIQVIEQLSQRTAASAAVIFIATHQLLPELAEKISQARRVLFVDADAHAPPGSIQCHRVRSAGMPGLLGHALAPPGLLQLCRRAYGTCPRSLLYTVGGAQWELPDTLSPPVAAAVARLTLRLLRRVKSEE